MHSARDMSLLTIRDLAHRLQIKASTLYLWVAQGKIPSLKIHGLVRFRSEAIDQWLASFEPTPATRLARLLAHPHDPDLDPVIAAATRAVYTPRRGKTSPRSRPIGKEETDGAL